MRLNDFVSLRHSFLLGALSVLLWAAIGCGSGGKGKVSGTVTLDGKPLPVGKIAFTPSKGTGTTGEIKDGQYSVDRVPVGDVKVTVETKSIEDRIQQLSMLVQNAARSQPPPGAPIPEEAKKQFEEGRVRDEKAKQELKELQTAYRPIPEKYSTVESSGLSLQVKSGPNSYDIPLSSK